MVGSIDIFPGQIGQRRIHRKADAQTTVRLLHHLCKPGEIGSRPGIALRVLGQHAFVLQLDGVEEEQRADALGAEAVAKA